MELIEFISDELVFDCNKLSTKLIKTEDGIDYLAYFVYSIECALKANFLISLRKQSRLKVSNPSYASFINRTATFINNEIIIKNKIDQIILPRPSSYILLDLVENISLRNCSIVWLVKSFPNIDLLDVVIDTDSNKITDNDRRALEKTLQMKGNVGYFEIKRLTKCVQEYIEDFIKLTADISLRNNTKERNILLMEDVYTTDSTLVGMTRYIELFSPNKVILTSLFK